MDNFSACFFVFRGFSGTFEPHLNHGGSSGGNVRLSWTSLHRFTYIYTKWLHQCLSVLRGGLEKCFPVGLEILRGIFGDYEVIGNIGLSKLRKGLREVIRKTGFLLREVPEGEDE